MKTETINIFSNDPRVSITDYGFNIERENHRVTSVIAFGNCNPSIGMSVSPCDIEVHLFSMTRPLEEDLDLRIVITEVESLDVYVYHEPFLGCEMVYSLQLLRPERSITCNGRILGGIASSLCEVKKNIHQFTDELKKEFNVDLINYILEE